MGLANAPALGERYAATKGGGATWNGRAIRVSARDHGRGHGRPGRPRRRGRATPRGDGLMRLIRGAKRNRGFGDFWGHMLVARGAAEVMVEPELASGTTPRWS